MPSAALLLPLLLPAPALAEDASAGRLLATSPRVSEVHAGVDGDTVVIEARTRSPREAPAAVALSLSPIDGAPHVADAPLRPVPAAPPEAMWQATGLTFDADASGATWPVEIALWGPDARPVSTLSLQVSDQLASCAPAATASWGTAGTARARLVLSPDGRTGTVEVALSSAAEERVAGVRVRLQRSEEGSRAPKAPRWARLAEVRQAWIATLPVPGPGAPAYQVDAIVEDAAGHPVGRAHAAAVTLSGPAPLAAGACPWPEAEGLAAGDHDDRPGLARR